MTYDLSIGQRLILCAALEDFQRKNMQQRDRDEIEQMQMLFSLNMSGGHYGVKKIKDIPV